MGIPVLILGESGSGKTYSIKNMDPDKVGIFSVRKGTLPFRRHTFSSFLLRGHHGISCPFPERKSAYHCSRPSLRRAARSPVRKPSRFPAAFPFPGAAGMEKHPCSRRRHRPELQYLNPSFSGCQGSAYPRRV